jgi:endonuclease I
MPMRILLFPVLFVAIPAFAQPPAGYYDPAEGLSGEALRQALYDIINGHTVVQNNQLWDAFALTDDKPDGTVWDIYSDVPAGSCPYVFQFVEDQCGTYDSEGDCFNREHSFPQSWFDSAAPMATDLFHIYPTDAWVNQQRGNLPYGTVANADWTSQNGGERGECSWPGCNGTVFEPIDAYKGDLARSYFYMLTRYLPNISSWNTAMLQGDDLSGWAESLLLAWHVQDPVSEKETDRNNAVFTLQDNRNPFIDRPEWAHYIWGPTASVSSVTSGEFIWYHSGHINIASIEAYDRILIIDSGGRLVLDLPVLPGISSIPVDLLSGVYVAKLVSEETVHVLRFIH